MSDDLLASIIIPAYERLEPLKYCVNSAQAALEQVNGEIIIVDDGSKTPLQEALSGNINQKVRFIRQKNQGSIVARLTGLNHAKGKYINFLDSDDLIHPQKITKQIEFMQQNELTVSYCDVGTASLDNLQKDYNIIKVHNYLTSDCSTTVFLRLHPNPHSFIYKKSFLETALRKPLIAPQRNYDPAGDIYLLYNLALHPTKIAHLAETFALITEHTNARYTQHWEKLGVASAALMQAFIKSCPVNSDTELARKLIGESAFISWRKLPRGVPTLLLKTLLQIHESCPKLDLQQLGGPWFQVAAKLIGLTNAARLFRLLRPKYEQIRTISDDEFNQVLAALE